MSNIVNLPIPKDATTTDKLVELLRSRDVDSLVMFGIDTEGTPFMAHTPAKTVTKLIVYLETMKGMLMDEVIAVDVAGVFEYKEEEG